MTESSAYRDVRSRAAIVGKAEGSDHRSGGMDAAARGARRFGASSSLHGSFQTSRPVAIGRVPWRPKVPSPTWRSFLRNHLPDIAAIDMFVVATATFHPLYALIVLSLDRRRVIHFAVTPNPTQDWLSHQMTEAFPWDTASRYLLRDRDKSDGPAFRHRVRAMGITEVITAPRSPWQNPYAERLIRSIRRECLDHVIIFNERHLCRILSSYFQYHHDIRTHLSLGKDCPRPRPIQSPSAGNIISFPEVGGLHHRYERRAA